jgi:nucleoid-associated protein YgaU
MKYTWLIIGLLLMGGCLTRTYVVEKPRVDLEVKGNRGYLSGEAGEEAAANKFGEKRKISVLEVELGAHERKKPQQHVSQSEAMISHELEMTKAVDDKEIVTDNEGPEFQEYIVQKEDTLQKISQKFYGTTKKWKTLYEENKVVLKSADKVYPGMKLKIPKID